MANPNSLLAMLPDRDQLALTVHLRSVDLERGAVLAEPNSEIRNVYFPHSGIISFMVGLEDGALVQTLMVGRDGVVGAAQALDTQTSVNKILVQVSGIASVIDRDPFREIVESRPKVRSLFAAHEQFLIADIQQTAACNARHSVESRMAKWILRMQDLVGDDLPLTQDSLAAMIGVRRSSVAEIAASMQAAGAISYARGRMHVIDTDALLRLACECHKAIGRNYSSLLGTPCLD